MTSNQVALGLSSESLTVGTKWARLRIVIFLIMIAAWVVQGLSYPHQTVPDGISYLETARACVNGHWSALINAYWSPAYPFLLALWLWLVRPSPIHELQFAHVFNVLLLFVALCVFEYFLNSLLSYVDRQNDDRDALPVWTFRLIGYTLFFWASLHATPPSLITPDVVVWALVLLVSATAIRIHSGADSFLRVVLLGALLGSAYLTKAVMFPLSFVVLMAVFLVPGKPRWALPRFVLALLAFGIVATPFISALSKSKGRFTFGDTGGIAYAEFVNGITPFHHWQGGPPGMGMPKHPTRLLMKSPAVYEFASPIAGSYPPETDQSYWYDGVKPHFDLKGQLSRIRHTSDTYFDLFKPLAPIFVGLLAILFFARNWQKFLLAFRSLYFLWIPALAGFAVYSLLLVDPRYVVAFAFLFWASLFAAIRVPSSSMRDRVIRSITLAVVLTLGVEIAWSVGHSTARLLSSRDVPEKDLVSALGASGLRPGDKVASVGDAIYDHYWAYLGRFSIVIEVPIEGVPAFWASDPATRAHVLALFASNGAKAVVAKNVSEPYWHEGWQRVGHSDYFVQMLSGAGPPLVDR